MILPKSKKGKNIEGTLFIYDFFLVSFPPRTAFYGRHHPNSFLEAASKAAAGLSEAGFHHVN